jgi:hypothetical protein
VRELRQSSNQGFRSYTPTVMKIQVPYSEGGQKEGSNNRHDQGVEYSHHYISFRKTSHHQEIMPSLIILKQ